MGLQKLFPLNRGNRLRSVPVGAEGKVYVEGRNDMDTKQKLGISWTIIDPEGIEVAGNSPYMAWGFGHTDPKDTHTFDGPTFDLDKLGTWWIAIGLIMNSPDPVMVDRYPKEEGKSAVLCEVTELAEHFDGTIVEKELEYDGVNIPIE